LIEWREFRIGVRVEKFAGIRKRRRFQVASVRLRLFHDNGVVYEKMKRLGIE
jgi:hypothetical protein